MGSIISATAFSAINSGGGSVNSVDLVIDAAEKCIASSGIAKEEIGILINIGVFRVDNIAEPSIASLIQQKLCLNLDFTSSARGEKSGKTLSLDIMKGSCGYLYAIKVVDTLLKIGEVKYAMIVSGDVHPSQEPRSDFPYSCVGAVSILSWTESNRGFRSLHFETSKGGDVGYVAYIDTKEMGTAMRKSVTVKFEENYAEKAYRFTLQTVKKYLRDQKINPATIRFLITSQHQDGFGRKLLESIGANDSAQTIDLRGQYGNSFTSSLNLGYHVAVEQKKIKKNEPVLFVATSSGLTTACGLYIP